MKILSNKKLNQIKNESYHEGTKDCISVVYFHYLKANTQQEFNDWLFKQHIEINKNIDTIKD